MGEYNREYWFLRGRVVALSGRKPMQFMDSPMWDQAKFEEAKLAYLHGYYNDPM